MSAPDPHPRGLDARELLEFLFAREQTFPSDKVAMLRHVGIIVAKNLQAARPKLDVAEDLCEATVCGTRRVALFDPETALMYRPECMPAEADGWVLWKLVRHRAVEPLTLCCEDLYTAKYKFEERKAVTVTAGAPFGHENVPTQSCVMFKLRNKEIYWYCHGTFQVLTLMPAYDGGCNDFATLHAVLCQPGKITYLLYDSSTKVAWRTLTAWSGIAHRGGCREVVPMRFPEWEDPWPELPFPHETFKPWYAACPWPKYELDFPTIHAARTHQFEFLRVLFASTDCNQGAKWTMCGQFGKGEVCAFPAIGRMLGKQLQDRFARAMRLTLLTVAQELEEARARDPVKRCAACAVQAAKDQLVLGLEPALKRRCGV